MTHFDVVADQDAVAARAAESLAEVMASAIAKRGRATLALSGGSLARPTYEKLRAAVVDWTKVELFWGDERAVSPLDEASNYRIAERALLAHLPLPGPRVHRMHGEESDLQGAALAYAAELEATLGDAGLDGIHLGMGADGHVCSLFPGHRLLAERKRGVSALTDAPKPPAERLTLTLPALWRAGRLVFAVAGVGKADTVRRVLRDGDPNLPATLVSQGGAEVHWILDEKAAALLR